MNEAKNINYKEERVAHLSTLITNEARCFEPGEYDSLLAELKKLSRELAHERGPEYQYSGASSRQYNNIPNGIKSTVQGEPVLVSRPIVR